MVSLKDVQSSNSRIPSTFRAGLVAVFVGATAGIGEFTLKQFAKQVPRPRIYFVGRSTEAGNRIAGECKALNAEGEYTFIQADISLIRNVDRVCQDIKSKEKVINLLFLTQGTTVFNMETSEGLHLLAALAHYSRARFIDNLLPLLQQATGLRRVVSVLAGGKEGTIFKDNLQARNLAILSARGHIAGVVTMSLEALAQKAPSVSFIHGYPGPVKTSLGRDSKGKMLILNALVFVLGPFINMPEEECGERHLFLATSARYPAAAGDGASGVPLEGETAIATGTNGKSTSGVYTADANNEDGGPKLEQRLAGLRSQGFAQEVWEDARQEFQRIVS